MTQSYVAIIESGGSNFMSIQVALARLGIASNITSDVECIQQASHVILPGVGMAQYAMQQLREKNLVGVIKDLRQPVLGICLGLQLLCRHSEEGDVAMLGIIPLDVKKIRNAAIVPHMGWNNMETVQQDPLLSDINAADDFYFVHSFAAETDADYTIGTCQYGGPFSAILRKDNFYGVQFHPEKSGKVGATLLKNFIIPSISQTICKSVISTTPSVIPAAPSVIPAKAGTHFCTSAGDAMKMGPRLRGDDTWERGDDRWSSGDDSVESENTPISKSLINFPGDLS